MPTRSLTLLVPPWLSPLRLARSTGRVAGSPAVVHHGVWSGPPGFGSAPFGLGRHSGLRDRLRTAWRRYRTRRCLAELDAHALRDIGITYAEAEAEANKPFWLA